MQSALTLLTRLPRLAPGIGNEPRRGDAVDGAVLVLLRGVAADPDRADDRAARRRADQHAAGGRHHAALRQRAERGEELRAAGGAARQLAAAETHAEHSPGLAQSDLG